MRYTYKPSSMKPHWIPARDVTYSARQQFENQITQGWQLAPDNQDRYYYKFTVHAARKASTILAPYTGGWIPIGLAYADCSNFTETLADDCFLICSNLTAPDTPPRFPSTVLQFRFDTEALAVQFMLTYAHHIILT